MRLVVQRVSEASVRVGGEVVGSIGAGLLVLLGISRDDGPREVGFLVDKTRKLRIFRDEAGKMNRSVEDVGGAVLAISQFTLYGDCRKGTRPSFGRAGPPELAEPLYESYLEQLRGHGLQVESGIFAAKMEVRLVNDGPVTLILESPAPR